TPLEGAVLDLADEVILAGGVAVGLALALDGEDVAHPGHLDALRIHARQGELDDVRAVLDPPLDGGVPRPVILSDLVRAPVEEPPEPVVDVAVMVVMMMQLRSGRRPANHGVHGILLRRSAPGGL